MALLATVTLPLSVPPAVGENTTANVRCCPAESVTGVPAPLNANPAPLSVIPEIVTLALPVFVTVTVCVEADPAFTLPKARLVLLKESVCEAATPIPPNPIVAGEFGALLTIETAPLTVPADAGENTMLKLVDWLAAREMGSDKALVLKPLPLALTCEIVNGPVPLFVSCTICVLGDPTVTSPKLAVDGVIVNAGCTPIPFTGITAVAPLELDTVMLPEMFSEAVGWKLTLMAVLWPACKVTGAEMPDSEKSLALTETCEIVTLALPLLVTVTVLVLLIPAFTLAKLTLAGLAESVTAAATPVPVSPSTFGVLGALLEMLMLPARLPAIVGANRTVKLALPPAAIVAGAFNPLTLYDAPLTESCATVSDAVPVFVTVKLCDFV